MLCQKLLLPICFVLLLRSFQQDSTCAGCKGLGKIVKALGSLAKTTSRVAKVAKVSKVVKTLVRKHPRIVIETVVDAGEAIGDAMSNGNSGGNPNSDLNHEGPDLSSPERDDDSNDENEDDDNDEDYWAYLNRLENDWFTPNDGYKYKKTPNVQSWRESRRVCQSWGSDLVKLVNLDASLRNIILRLLAPSDGFWFDLDENFEGVCCVNGVLASSSPARRISIRNDDDSGFVNICAPNSNLTQQQGVSCNSHHYGICEKAFQ